MPATSLYGFRYLSLSDPPDIPAGTQNLAEDVEAKVASIDAAIAALPPPAAVWNRQDTPITGITSGTYAAGSPVCGVAFTAPATGRVKIDLISYVGNSGAFNTFVAVEVRTGSVIGSGSIVQAADDALALMNVGSQVRFGGFVPLTGLTPGSPYNARLLHRVIGGTGEVTQRLVYVAAAP